MSQEGAEGELALRLVLAIYALLMQSGRLTTQQATAILDQACAHVLETSPDLRERLQELTAGIQTAWTLIQAGKNP